jgi:hypothetical protein
LKTEEEKDESKDVVHGDDHICSCRLPGGVRDYCPTEAALDGTYKVPPVRKVQ